MRNLWASLKRGFRAGVAIAVPLVIQYITTSTDTEIMAIAPVLMGIGKYLRDKYGWKWLPV